MFDRQAFKESYILNFLIYMTIYTNFWINSVKIKGLILKKKKYLIKNFTTINKNVFKK